MANRNTNKNRTKARKKAQQEARDKDKPLKRKASLHTGSMLAAMAALGVGK